MAAVVEPSGLLRWRFASQHKLYLCAPPSWIVPDCACCRCEFEFRGMVRILQAGTRRKKLQLRSLEGLLRMKESQLQSVQSELQGVQAELQGIKSELYGVQGVLQSAQAESLLKTPCYTIGSWDTGLLALARVAKHLIEELELSDVVGSLLNEPLTAVNIAQVYQCLWTEYHENKVSDAEAKDVFRVVRDLLVLKVTIGKGPWSNSTLQFTVGQLFNKPLQKGFHVADQVVLSFNQIRRLAQDRDLFDKTNILLFVCLTPSERNAVHDAYASSLCTTPHYKSKSAINSRLRPGRPLKNEQVQGSRPLHQDE